MITPPRRVVTMPRRKRRGPSGSETGIDHTGQHTMPRKSIPNPLLEISRSALPAARGPLQRKAYKEDWLESARFLRGIRAVEYERASTVEKEDFPKAGNVKAGGGFGALRLASLARDFEEEDDAVRVEPLVTTDREHPPVYPITPARAAARLILARMIDERPDLNEALRDRAPVVAIDVPDLEMLDRVLDTWQHTILGDGIRVHKVINNVGKRRDSDVLLIVAKEAKESQNSSASEKLSQLYRWHCRSSPSRLRPKRFFRRTF